MSAEPIRSCSSCENRPAVIFDAETPYCGGCYFVRMAERDARKRRTTLIAASTFMRRSLRNRLRWRHQS
ncbi:MAG TPA: hypothetical protein VGF69_20665 [Thermoanaerobaculia bacterium]|jgi:hypothetical protein